jgi:hypothetical protein
MDMLPPGWTVVVGSVWGAMCMNPDDANEDDMLDFFDEDIFCMRHEYLGLTLDVGWYPAGDKEGHFGCKAIQGDIWDGPIDELNTRSPLAVWKWLSDWVSDAGSMGTDMSWVSDQK